MRILLRYWRRLTSMRTALVLLFLLAVAAVPGSLLPQTTLDAGKVRRYIAEHGAWGRFLDTLGMYDVFGSAWFSAIYLLLFVSLIGCLVPRIKVYSRAVARAPLAAPRNLSRLPESAKFETSSEGDDFAAAARERLGRKWRVAQRTEETGAVTLSAEKGYSREAGNLLFHIALLAALILIAIGRLYSYEGSKVVVQGNGFCSAISQYDDWRPGRFASEGKVSPAKFCIDRVDKFVAKYSDNDEPRTYRADVTYRSSLGAAPRKSNITVNHPLRLDDDRVYLINHGYAPSVTVRMPDGTVQRDTQVFLPTDSKTYYSEGAFKLYGKPDAKQDVGISGYFAPSPAANASGLVTSTSPKTDNPVLGVRVFTGTVNPNGEPQSVYTLDTQGLKRDGSADLRQGETKRFPNGVTVTFNGWKPWVSLQVSHNPAQGWLLGAAVAMVLGLGLSLGVRRRRLWLRIRPGEGSATVVTVGGLARSDSGNFTTEFEDLLSRLRAGGPPAAESLGDRTEGVRT